MESVRVFASASVANVACGFDVLGFALNEPGDEVILTKNNSGTLKIISIEGDEGQLPKEIEKNTGRINFYTNCCSLRCLLESFTGRNRERKINFW